MDLLTAAKELNGIDKSWNFCLKMVADGLTNCSVMMKAFLDEKFRRLDSLFNLQRVKFNDKGVAVYISRRIQAKDIVSSLALNLNYPTHALKYLQDQLRSRRISSINEILLYRHCSNRIDVRNSHGKL